MGLSLFVVLGAARAASWTPVFEDAEHTVYVDLDRIKRDAHGYRLVWVMSDYTKHPLVDPGSGVTATVMVERDSIDCGMDRIKVLSAQLYDPQGNNLGQPDLSAQTYRDIPPDSTIEAIEHAVCGQEE
ncbi:hypothetical protein Busp01_01310 [Trinickia caryophylli]|nr:hypothetical protein Busp01_01310 [Trinickia caryophylli]